MSETPDPLAELVPPRLALTRQEAAGALGISVDSFERHCQGEIRCIYIGSRRLYAITDLQTWLDRTAVAPNNNGREAE